MDEIEELLWDFISGYGLDCTKDEVRELSNKLKVTLNDERGELAKEFLSSLIGTNENTIGSPHVQHFENNEPFDPISKNVKLAFKYADEFISREEIKEQMTKIIEKKLPNGNRCIFFNFTPDEKVIDILFDACDFMHEHYAGEIQVSDVENKIANAMIENKICNVIFNVCSLVVTFHKVAR